MMIHKTRNGGAQAGRWNIPILCFLITTGSMGAVVIVTPRNAEDTASGATIMPFGDETPFADSRLSDALNERRLRLGRPGSSTASKANSYEFIVDRRPAEPSAASPSAAARASAGGAGLLAKAAARIFFRLKASPRFKDSPALKAYAKDFLSQPDLAEIDRRYKVDRDPLLFVVRTLRSPSLGGVVKRNIVRPDVAAFMIHLMGDPAFSEASAMLAKHHGIGRSLERLNIPGIGRLDATAKKFSGGPAPSPAQTLERLGMDPGLADPSYVLRSMKLGRRPAVYDATRR